MPDAMVQNFALENTTKGKLPSLPFLRIKERVLGNHYELSVVFIGDKRSRDLNKRYRGKDRPTNILSFSLSASEGEIFINLRQAKKDAPQFKKRYNTFVGFLFIHGLLHLKGLDHGRKMEREEERFMRAFKL